MQQYNPLSIEEVTKAIWLKKKKNFNLNPIAVKLNRSYSAIDSCLESIEQRYWSVDPKTITAPHDKYLRATFIAKQLLIKDKDPFKDDMAPVVKEAYIEMQKQLSGTEIAKFLQPTADIPPSEENDIFKEFEQTVITAVTKLTTAIVNQQVGKTLAENESLKKEIDELRQNNESLIKKNMAQKQSSLADSLRLSLSK